jgi:hypothetical protein
MPFIMRQSQSESWSADALLRWSWMAALIWCCAFLALTPAGANGAGRRCARGKYSDSRDLTRAQIRDPVLKIIKQIGLDMVDNPAFTPLILAPLKSQGVNRIDDSTLIIRCKCTAIPGQQYLIRSEAFTQIQRAFEEKGIQFAPRRVLVEATTPEEAVNTAAGVLDQENPADPSKPPHMSISYSGIAIDIFNTNTYSRALGELWQLLQLPKQKLRVIDFAGLECPGPVIEPVY